MALGMGVSEAKARIPYAEFIEWIAMNSIDPWTLDRGDLQAGIVAATVANSNPYRKGPAAKPSDFMPKWGERFKRQSGRHMAAIFAAFAGVHNRITGKNNGDKSR